MSIVKNKSNSFCINMSEHMTQLSFETLSRVDEYNITMANKLRASAEKLRERASTTNTEVNGNWTHRRQNFADNARRKKEKIILHAHILDGLADKWINDKEFIIRYNLANIKSSNNIDEIYFPSPPDGPGWYYDEYPEKLKRANRLLIFSKDDANKMLEGIKILKEMAPKNDPNKDKLRELLIKARSFNIPGFFPTSDNLILMMLKEAQIRPGEVILEPSAGIGSICDHIKEYHPNCIVDCVEINHSLVEILNLKKHNPYHGDIFDYNVSIKYDKIIMNPPFENNQDIEHVMHCYENYLKEGGRLIALTSIGAYKNTRTINNRFKQWLSTKPYSIQEISNAFNGAFRNTSVSVILFVIEKPLPHENVS